MPEYAPPSGYTQGAGSAPPPPPPPPPAPRAAPRGRAPKEEPGMFETMMKSPVTRSVASQITRGLMGALLGGSSRRRRSIW